MKKIRVAVLFGGQSNEHKISLKSSISIIKALDQEKYKLTLIGIDRSGQWKIYEKEKYLINSNDLFKIRLTKSKRRLVLFPNNGRIKIFQISPRITPVKVDIIFSTLHGGYGENGSMQGLLNILNIPYVGSNILGSAICINKDLTKRMLRKFGILTAPSITLNNSKNFQINFKVIKRKIGFPMFIKPISQGSSIGVSKISNEKDFYKAINLAFQYDNRLLVEKNIVGREIEIAILGNENPLASLCGEILIDKDFYTYEKKYIEGKKSNLVLPARLDKNIERKIRKIAIRAFSVLGCQTMARIDFFLTKTGKIFLNEINTIPGLHEESMYPSLWKISGLSYKKLIMKLIDLSFEKKD